MNKVNEGGKIGMTKLCDNEAAIKAVCEWMAWPLPDCRADAVELLGVIDSAISVNAEGKAE